MNSIHEFVLESNKRQVINFEGGDLSSDGGLLMMKEFLAKIGLEKVLGDTFRTNDTAKIRVHTDVANLLQMI